MSKNIELLKQINFLNQLKGITNSENKKDINNDSFFEKENILLNKEIKELKNKQTK